VLAVLVVAALSAASAPAATSPLALTVFTDQLQSPPFVGLGVEFDPYDTLSPTTIDWPMIEQRLDFMSPGFLRVVEPASDYFGGYDSAGQPTYKWAAPHVQELLTILAYAQARGITVVLGDWGDPAIKGDARIPADFILALRDTYGFTDIRYYNVENEPNNDDSTCPFSCWASLMQTVATEFAAVGLSSSVQLIGPDNENSWDDTAQARSLDLSSGLDTDDPIGGDAWVTGTLDSIPQLIGAYDSHRYATPSGLENGVYGDQVRARRLEITNLDSAAKPYFAAEVGLVARLTDPFGADEAPEAITHPLSVMLDPSTLNPGSTFVDSQPDIEQYQYGVWMADLVIQAIDAGLSGASAWDLDDAMHTGGGYGSENLKQWGFWNSLGGQDGYPPSDLNPRQWYYAWSLLSRAFPAGSQPLVVSAPAAPGLHVAAARLRAAGVHGPQAYGLSLAVVNDSETTHTVDVSIPAVDAPLALSQYDYFPPGVTLGADGLPTPARTDVLRFGGQLQLKLPAEGLVVLTSADEPAVLDQGTTLVTDDLHSWGLAYSHTRGLRFDHSNVAEFNYSASRVTPFGRRAQTVVYRARQLTSFGLDAYYAKSLHLTAYGSENGDAWAPITLASTQPAPAVGGHELLVQLLPAAPLPAGTNRLKLLLGPGTELAQVQLAAERSGPACAASTGTFGGTAVDGVGLGSGPRAVTGAIGVALVQMRHTWSYCVTGGGTLAFVFAGGHVELAATDARGYRLDGVPVGASLTSLERRFRARGLRAAGPGVLVSPAGATYLVLARRVRAEGLAAGSLVPHTRALLAAIRRSGVTPSMTLDDWPQPPRKAAVRGHEARVDDLTTYRSP
jgi:hypothetical protein